MANNRLYLVDRSTGEWCFLAKAMGHGWYTTPGLAEKLDEFFAKIDPNTGKPLDWACSAGFDGFSTRLVVLDESEFDPSGMAEEKRRIVKLITTNRGDK